jgi:hypothetical protein
MFAFNYARGVAKFALEVTTDALGLTTDQKLTVESIEHVEFKTVDMQFDTTVLTELDDDDFTIVIAPSGFVPHGYASDPSVRLSAAVVYLNSCPSDPTAKRTFKNAFLLLAGYDNPDDVPYEVATTIAEACVQEHSCQSLDRQRELKSATTSSLPTVSVTSNCSLSDLVRDDYGTPVDP